MKSKQEVEKWIRDEVSNPMIGKMIMDMTEQEVPYEDIMGMAKILIDNTPNVEEQLVKKYMRIQDGDDILSTIK